MSALTASITPSDAAIKDVIFSSSDTDVVSVNNDGTITAIKSGEALITVETVNGNFTATCLVKVIQPATGITLDVIWAEIIQGDTILLTAKVNPDGATNNGVTYISSDETVAKVGNNGQVSSLKEGKVIITAISEDGFSAECEIEVVKTLSIQNKGLSDIALWAN